MRPNFEDMVNRSGGNISVRDAEILYETAMVIAAKSILEIGSREGGSSMVLGTVANTHGGQLICIEPEPLDRLRENMKHYELKGRYVLVRMRSPWVDTGRISKMASERSGQPSLDYLFVDGDHRTRWILTDYHYWEPLVRPGGRIAFHDWTGKNGVGEQVQRAVSIILETDDLREVIRNESTDRGIIVFEKRR